MICQLSKCSLWRRIIGMQSRLTMSTSSSSSSSSQAVKLSLAPSVALVDDAVSISVTGLHSYQHVTLAAAVKESAGVFMSHAHYTADAAGVVDVALAASSGGTYTGREAMGLFWSMLPAQEERPGLRLTKKDVTTPFLMQIQVRAGHQEVRSVAVFDAAADLLDSGCLERWYMASGVRRIKISNGQLRGMLFLPPGEGPFPGVIDLFGTAGGLIEIRSALLASRGFAALALPYFAYEDLPEGLEFNMEYFEDAVDYLSSHPMVKHPAIGVVGVSMGAEIASYMAIAKKQVIACISINGFHFYTAAGMYKNGKQIATALPDISMLHPMAEIGSVNMYKFQESYLRAEGSEEATIKFEKAPHCQFLLIHGEDDHLVGPYHRDKQQERFERHGCTNYRILSFAGAGHLLEPPYTPHCAAPYHKMFLCYVDYGGEMVGHAKAQEKAWKVMLDFLHEHLDNQTGQPSIV